MVSHLVSRRSFTPYGVILYHPCGSHSQAKHEDADEPVYGLGPVCDACLHPTAEFGGVTVAPGETRSAVAAEPEVLPEDEEPIMVKVKRPTRPKPRE